MIRKSLLVVCLLMAIGLPALGFAPRAHASLASSINQVPGVVGDPGEQFGNSVAVSADGGSILVGAPKADFSTGGEIPTIAGEAFLFDSNGNHLQTYRDPTFQFGNVAGEQFGMSVAISADGSRILIGAPSASLTTAAGASVSAGMVFLFDSSGTFLGSFQDPNPTSGESFGSSVAISGDASSILIGAPGATASGEAFLFDSSGTLLQTYQDPNPINGNHFGASVSIVDDGSSILIGAPFCFCIEALPSSNGEAFLFDSSANLLQTFQDPTPTGLEEFGFSVSISADGSSIVIGARCLDLGPTPPAGPCRSGEALLFDSSGSLLQTYQDPNPTRNEAFGGSVSISADGSSVLIGAVGATASGVNAAGEAFLFDSSGSLLQTYQDPNPTTAESFGSSVSISADGTAVLIGAIFVVVTDSSGNTPIAGEAFLFDDNQNLLQTYQDPALLDREGFGSSVSVSADGSAILIGAPAALATTPATTKVNAGEAFLFDSVGNILQTYQDPDPASGERFGTSVALSADGSTILVGATLASVTTLAGATVVAGEAFLFDSGGNLLQTYQDPGASGGEMFGNSVAVSATGSSVVIGAVSASVVTSMGATVQSGEAFLFDSSGNLLQTYQDPNPMAQQRFGNSVSITADGSTVLIGAPVSGLLGGGGEAFLFDSGGNLLQTYQVLGLSTDLNFGSSVAISGDGSSILVGAPGINRPTPVAGQAFLFDSVGNILQTYQDPNPAGRQFGLSVSISGDGSRILVGGLGPQITSSFPDLFAGEAVLFDSSGNLLAEYFSPSQFGFEFFGSSVSISADGSAILTGAPGDNVGPFGKDFGGLIQVGKAFLFDSGGNLLQTYLDPRA